MFLIIIIVAKQICDDGWGKKRTSNLFAEKESIIMVKVR